MQRAARTHEVCWCAACNTQRRANKRWIAGTYLPAKPGATGVAYFICNICINDPKRISTARLMAETFSRNADESKVGL
jgi:hypothetical protein